MEKEKVLVLKGKVIFLLKKIQNHLVIQITQNILEKKILRVHQLILLKKTLALKERKNLRTETVDLKTSLSKNMLKKEEVFKFF